MRANIAIIGLGRVGTDFLSYICQNQYQNVNVVAVSELNDTAGRRIAITESIPVKNVQDIANMGDCLDLIFDLTGDPEVRTELRFLLHNLGNHHTSIATENVVDLIWALTSGKSGSDVHESHGYLVEAKAGCA